MDSTILHVNLSSDYTVYTVNYSLDYPVLTVSLGLGSTLLHAKIVALIRKYHNHKLQTNSRHREEEPHNAYLRSDYTVYAVNFSLDPTVHTANLSLVVLLLLIFCLLLLPL